MFLIKEVQIKNLWGKCEINTSFNDDVNIFIGDNGTGKTTFINILQSVLCFNIDLLGTLPFESVTLLLKDSETRKERKITVTKYSHKSMPYDMVKYRISKYSFEVPLFESGNEYRHRMMLPKFARDIEGIRYHLNEIVNVSWLSVHRALLDEDYFERQSRSRSIQRINPVDFRLIELMRKFTQYQLKLQADSNQLSENFQRDVLATILYDKTFDTFEKLDPIGDINTKSMEEDLLNAYEELKALNPQVKKKIKNHAAAIELAKQNFSKDDKISLNDLFPLVLARRTQYITGLSKTNKKSKIDIFHPINTFLEMLRGFLNNKAVELDTDKSGKLSFKQDGADISLEQLSSGEKQLLILLIETLLQRNNSFIFISDEPELSLHINWQKQIISSIRSLNPNAQIITATHSPEIVGEWSNKTVDMQTLING